MHFYTMKKDEALKALSSSVNGLKEDEAERRLSSFGENKLKGKKKKSLIKRFLSQFCDFSIIALIVSAALSFGISYISGDKDVLEPVIILAIVILNAVIGVVQESRAISAIEALKSISSPKSRVIRDGKIKVTDSEKIVPGDILSLEAGDLVPADCMILKESSLLVNESSLTGESESVSKDASFVCEKNTPVTKMANFLFSSTLISEGHAVALVVATGMDTKVGILASMIEEENNEKTPLAERLNSSSKVMVLCAVLCCVILFFIGIFKKYDPLFMFMTSVTLAVAAIPEGLSAIVTVMLALSVSKMAKSGAVVRNLPAVETLGSATFICTDKTGTLTENKMTVKHVTGDREKVLKFMAICSEKGENPTEKAILKASGLDKDKLDSEFKRLFEIPFSSKRKRMVTVNSFGDKYITLVKGAFDIIMPFCSFAEINGQKRSLTKEISQKLKKENDSLAESGMRVIALACKITDTPENDEKDLTFMGMAALSDPLRKEAKKAVKECIEAGIRVVMITGDHKKTALSIGRELGIDKGGVIEGTEVDSMSEEELKNSLNEVSVFARVLPEHKMKIIKALKSKGHIAAMTGDGVNDGPALSSADIGIAMGKSGTDVARCASDMILTDDNFATIVKAVKEGRTLFANIRKAIHFLLSSNMGEIILMMAGFLLGNGAVLFPVQLLWVNLITDSLPAISLGMDKASEDIMLKKPKNLKKSFFSEGLLSEIIFEGALIGAIAYAAFTFGNTRIGGGEALGRTMAFCTLSISQLIHAFCVRTEKSVFLNKNHNFYLIGSFFVGFFLQYLSSSTPLLCKIFKTTPLDLTSWFYVFLFSLVPLFVSEVSKLLKGLKS